MNLVYSIAVLLSTCLLSTTAQQDNKLIIETKNGQVQGKTIEIAQQSGSKHQVNAWMGIPFAEKPINELRFKPPVPVKNWNGILNTTSWPNTCYQIIDPMVPVNTPVSEDCLYLNVFAPNPLPQNAAVMVN
jgi:carboxylesterase type B